MLSSKRSPVVLSSESVAETGHRIGKEFDSDDNLSGGEMCYHLASAVGVQLVLEESVECIQCVLHGGDRRVPPGDSESAARHAIRSPVGQLAPDPHAWAMYDPVVCVIGPQGDGQHRGIKCGRFRGILRPTVEEGAHRYHFHLRYHLRHSGCNVLCGCVVGGVDGGVQRLLRARRCYRERDGHVVRCTVSLEASEHFRRAGAEQRFHYRCRDESNEYRGWSGRGSGWELGRCATKLSS
mmetsp:Transcript_16815/g.34036  ORF Transcript_16815/g.34036 Transcript_16815/m.34036 type:complete len:238 (+) Transcript_16815:167-880(+)